MVIAGRAVLADETAPPAVASRSIGAADGVPPVRLLPRNDLTGPRRARVSGRIGASGLMPDVLVLVTERAVEVLHADVAAVGLPDAAGTTITVDVVAGDPAVDLCGTTIPAAGWHLDEVVHRGHSVVVADLSSSGLHPSLVDLASIGPCLAVPLWGRLRPYGVLLVGRHRGARPFPDHAVADLQGLTGS